MTAKAKIAVTLPQELVDSVREEVRTGRADSVSGYVADAVAAHLQRIDLATMLAQDLIATGGPMTDEERAEIDRELGLA